MARRPGFAGALSTPADSAVIRGTVRSMGEWHGQRPPDIARGAGLPWAIGPDEARPVLGQSMPTMTAPAPDTAKARGVGIAFDLRAKGGPRWSWATARRR